MPGSPKRIDESEDCAELDADYFQSLGSTFDVVDAWDENDEVQIKTEPNDDSNHSKASSKKSSNKDPEANRKTSSRHGSRSNTRPERSQISPVRRRSPDRKRLSSERSRNRFSPRRSPERNRNYRDDRFRRSPPRNVGQFDRRRPASPDRNRNQPPQAKKSFLEEIQEKFMMEGRRDEQIDQMLQQGGKIDLNIANFRPEPSRNFQNLQMHFNNQQNPMTGFMNDQIMPQHFNPMMMQQMPPMQPIMMNMPNMQYPPNMHVTSPVPTNIFMNPLEIMQPSPLPVPPPPQQMEPTFAPGTEAMGFPQFSPPVVYQNSNNDMNKQPVTIVRENVELPQIKKTLNEPAKNLIDILRQKSKQNTKSSVDEELASRKAKVLERCKSAVGLITDLEKNKSKVPLACALPSHTIHKPNITINKSPLLTSENNPRFMFQASPDQCFSVLENHPIKNIYGETAEIAQYLKLDLHELSSIVARESIIRPPALTVEPQATAAPVIINDYTNIFGGKKTSSKEVQTGPFTCKRCCQMDMIKQSAISQACQTTEEIPTSTKVQNDNQDETDGFRFFIDAQTLADRNFEQHHALEVFSRAFGIQCPFIDRDREQEMIKNRSQIPEETDERWSFTNPENPNKGSEIDNFFSTSPIQKRQTKPRVLKSSKSPPRFKMSKSPPRFKMSKSPLRFQNSSSPSRFRNSNSPPRFRISISPSRRPNSPTLHPNSPLRHRNSNSPPRIRQNRSVFERIGEKIPDNADSPRNYEDWNDEEFNNRETFCPYTIPSPHYVAPRERSPEPSRRYRNRSRSRSASRSLSRSPKRYRSGNKILNRRGRL